MRGIRRTAAIVCSAALLPVWGFHGGVRPGARSAVPLRAVVVSTRPHAVDAFTEGLVFADRARLYESTGLYGRSEVRLVDLRSGAVLRRASLDPTEFGEGLAAVGDRLVQLTYREHHAVQWSRDRFERAKAFEYEGEGWGLAYDTKTRRLVMSNGSSTLVARDPKTFAVMGRITVRRAGKPVDGLNELEVVGGVVWANVWPTEEILRIDRKSGVVTGVLDATGLLSPQQRLHADVLNGIAHRRGDPSNRLWITGKLWPTMFEVKIVAAR